MKAYLRELIHPAETNLEAIHIVREYLQARILQSLQRAGAMRPLAFHGGTSLRFLFNMPRYSEDLDFALDRYPEEYDFRKYLNQIEKDFSVEAYDVDLKLNDKRVVHKAFVRFRGLLHELELSGHKTETITVKIEIDTNPPSNTGLTTTSFYRHLPLHLQHHDRATLFAGKLNAVLQRLYLKGRDIYDLWWYLSQPEWPEPNFAYLNSGLAQGEWNGPRLTETNWRNVVCQQLQPVKWRMVLEDVEPFIIVANQELDFNKEQLLKLLQ